MASPSSAPLLSSESTPLLGDGSSSTSDQGRNDSSTAELRGLKLALTMAFVWLGSFLAALDSTITTTLSATIASEFNSLIIISWLGSSYLVATAAVQPLSGKLTDIFSRRSGLLLSSLLFGAGNLLCGFARREWVMILGRFFAGMGGGGLNAISTFVATDLIPLRQRGLWHGLGMLLYGLGLGLGGVLGGLINDFWGWRWAFLLLTPLTLVSATGVWFTVERGAQHQGKTSTVGSRGIDCTGAILLVLSTALLLAGLNFGTTGLGWTHPLVTVTLPTAVVLLGIFIYVECYLAPEPIIPVRMLLDRSVAGACLAFWFSSMTLYTLMYYVPLFYQVQGRTTTRVGLQLLPESVGVATGCLVWSGWVFSQQIDTPAWASMVYLFFNGLGFGGSLTVLVLALISAVPQEMQAVTTATSYAFRSTGSTIGITVASVVFNSVLKQQLQARLPELDWSKRKFKRFLDACGDIERPAESCRQDVLDSYMQALT